MERKLKAGRPQINRIMVEKLPVGEYTLRERAGPDGYLIAEECENLTVKEY